MRPINVAMRVLTTTNSTPLLHKKKKLARSFKDNSDNKLFAQGSRDFKKSFVKPLEDTLSKDMLST